MRTSVVSLLVILNFLFSQANAADLNLQSQPAQSSDGKLTLSWSLSQPKPVELQQSINQSAFQTIYIGNDTSSVLTGLSDGQYRFRARFAGDEDGHAAWSDISQAQVKHHSLSKAFSFFLLGALVFLATILVIFFGSRQHNHETN